MSDPEEFLKYNGPDRIVHWQDFLMLKVGKKKDKRFKSGFQRFDEASGGLGVGEVVVISGNTKNGKTLFAESWLQGMMATDPAAKAAVFSFEVETEKLLIKYQKLDDTMPLYVPVELKAMDYDWLLARCKEAKYKHNCRIILIDHLHFLVDMNTKQNMSLNIGAFMRRLKHEIALGLNLSVILIAHQGQPRDKQEASLQNVRDSSFVGQESDATIIVSRRKNIDPVEMKDYESKYNKVISHLFDLEDVKRHEDPFSDGLATVKIEVHRHTGVFGWTKTFKKVGNFLREL